MDKKDKRTKKLQKLCKTIKVGELDLELLNQALTHSSFAHEVKNAPKLQDNERLEFLGDAVLGLSVSSYIYEKFPKLPEGEMSKLRARVVCEAALAKFARNIHLGEYLLFGKGEEASGGKDRDSILSDAMEAVIGACYVDKGFETARKLALFLTEEEICKFVATPDIDDYKTRFQETVQKDGTVTIKYKLLSEKGPSHEKYFEIALFVDDNKLATGTGSSKKEAEQMAAKRALQRYLN